MTTQPDGDDAVVEHVERDLERWLVAHARAGVPEVVLVAILRQYADQVETLGYVPRRWKTPAATVDNTES
jgi:hypothetical protein